MKVKEAQAIVANPEATVTQLLEAVDTFNRAGFKSLAHDAMQRARKLSEPEPKPSPISLRLLAIEPLLHAHLLQQTGVSPTDSPLLYAELAALDSVSLASVIARAKIMAALDRV